MIVQPEKFIDEIAATGATYMNIHYEACTHLHRVVQEIRKKGMKPAVTKSSYPNLPIGRYFTRLRHGFTHVSKSRLWRTAVY